MPRLTSPVRQKQAQRPPTQVQKESQQAKISQQYEKDINKLNEYKQKLEEKGFKVEISETGELKSYPPEGMSELEANYLRIKFAPSDTPFYISKDGVEKEVSKEEALSVAKKAYDLEQAGKTREQINKELGTTTSSVILTAQAITRPEVGGALLRETWEKLTLEWSKLIGSDAKTIERETEEAYNAQKARLEAQGKIDTDFAKVEKQGTWEAYATFFAPEITTAALYITTMGISSVIGRVAPSIGSYLSSKGISTIAGMAPSTIAKIGGYVLTGTALAPTVVNAYQQYDSANKRQQEIEKEYQNKIDNATTQAEKESLQRELYSQLEEIERQKWDSSGSVLKLVFDYSIMVHAGMRGYKYGYQRGVQSQYIKRFPKGSPERQFIKQGFKSTRLLSKVPSKFKPDTVKPKSVSSDKFLTAEQMLKSNKRLVLSGSSASQRQLKPGTVQPKDYDIYILKDKQIPQVKQLLGGKKAGFDIHGSEFYSGEGTYHKQGWFTQRTVKIKGVRMLSSGEQLTRKWQGSVDYMLGEAPFRGKDIPSYWTHYESQLESALSSYNPITRAKGKLAQYYMKPYSPTKSFTSLRTPTKPKLSINIQPPSTYPTTSLYKPITPIIKPKTVYPTRQTYRQKTPKIYPKRETYHPSKITRPMITTPPSERGITEKRQKKRQPQTFKFKPTTTRRKKPTVKEQGYNVYIKKSGNTYIKANTSPLTREQALGYGAEIVDNTLSQSFKIKPASAAPISSPVYANEWNKRKHKFGNPAVDRKIVEKTKYRKDTVGEKKGQAPFSLPTIKFKKVKF